jgi:hypothetical protein
MHFSLQRRLQLPLLAVVLAAGCGNSGASPDIYETVDAAGTLTYNGQPIEYYQVTFHQEGKRPAQGLTDKDGKFVLGTNAAGDGAPAGKHKVTVTFAPPTPDSATSTPEEVAKGTPKPKFKLPTKYTDREKTDLEVEIPAGGSKDLKIDLKG